MKNKIIGFIAGIVSGFFGAGGGMILVPAFSHINKMEEKESRATSIFCILPLVIASCIIYMKNQYMDWNIGIKSAIGGIVRWNHRLNTIKKTKQPNFKHIIYNFFTICSNKNDNLNKKGIKWNFYLV